MIGLKNIKINKIPVFFHVPKSAGSYIRSWQKKVLEDNLENGFCNKSIIINNTEGNPILKLEIVDDGKLETNRYFNKNMYYDSSVFEISIKDFKTWKKENQIKIFSCTILSYGFCIHEELLDLIKEISNKDLVNYIIIREPLDKEISFYNYIVTEKPHHEKDVIKLKSKSFKSYVESEEMSDSWLINSLVNAKKPITEKDFDKTIEILKDFLVFDFDMIDHAIKKINKICYNIDLKIDYNAPINKNKSKIRAGSITREDVSEEIKKIFELRKKWEYKIYEKYYKGAGGKNYFDLKKEVKREDCFFCHTMSFEEERIVGTWDFSECINEYFGGQDFKNKRVIDIGSGAGYHSFYMEKMGATVVSHELPDGSYWDFFKHPNSKRVDKSFNKAIINSYLYAHKKNKSKNKLLLWNLYEDLPEEVGSFDIAVFSMVLSHFRDPFLALMNVLYKTKERAILINTFADQQSTSGYFYGQDGLWWDLSKQCIHCFMEKVGFRLVSENEVYPYNEDVQEKKKYKALVFERY
jgi:SAM-dependent methyltransferase